MYRLLAELYFNLLCFVSGVKYYLLETRDLMTDDLLMAIRKLEGINTNNLNYSFVYLFSNENIRGFTKKISFDNNKVLTVCSSGDQMFNLILNGANEVDLFDINIFTKHYFYLKKAAIEGLLYDEFLSFFFPNLFSKKIFNFETYLKIRNFIDNSESKYFWDYLFCHYSSEDIYYSKLFSRLEYSKNNIIEANDYLSNEFNYNKLKLLLKNKTFNFYHINLFKDKVPNDKKYDFIYLSNIFDYLFIEDKLKYANKVKEIILDLNENISSTGMIAISYLFLCFDDYYEKIDKLKSKEFKEVFIDSDCEYISFPGLFALKDNQERNKDALMLYKKNNC